MNAYKILRLITAPLVSNKAYADIVPLNAIAPYIRYAQIGGKLLTTVCNSSHIDAMVPLVQIDVHAEKGEQRELLMVAVDNAIKQYNSSNAGALILTEAPVLMYDSETKTHKAVFTYQIKE